MEATPAAPAAPALPPVKPPGFFAGLVHKLTALPRWLWRLPLPVKAAWVVALVQFAIVIAAWTVFLLDPNSVPWRHALTWSRILLVLGLLVIIPLVVHRALRLWLEGDPLLFPDIDYAWQAGLEALAQNGLAIDAIPVFVVLGSVSEQQERALVQAAGLDLRVRGVPEGPAPLRWFANPDAIYLFLSESSWVSGLAAASEKGQARLAAPAQAESSEAALVYARGEAATPVDDDNAGRGTMLLDPYLAAQAAGGSAQRSSGPGRVTERLPALGGLPPVGGGGAEAANRGTMMLQPGALTAAAPAAAAAGSRASGIRSALGDAQPALLSPQDAADQVQRLQYVAQLLRRARQPLCAINGGLVLLPFSLISGSARGVDELGRAVHGDRLMLARTLGLRAPLTALVVGLEAERGFRELVRRVGRDRAQLQRFGRGFDLRSQAGAEELNNLSEHLAGTFEDWIYTLFRERDALSRPGNTRLYSLLCKVRSNLKDRLGSVLVQGFAHDPVLDPHDDPALFSGCYFAATGESEDRQAFVKAVFDKLLAEQEQVEWTQRALGIERRYLSLGLAGGAVDILLAASLAGMIGWSLWRR